MLFRCILVAVVLGTAFRRLATPSLLTRVCACQTFALAVATWNGNVQSDLDARAIDQERACEKVDKALDEFEGLVSELDLTQLVATHRQLIARARAFGAEAIEVLRDVPNLEIAITDDNAREIPWDR